MFASGAGADPVERVVEVEVGRGEGVIVRGAKLGPVSAKAKRRA
jgi:hypothetical protein